MVSACGAAADAAAWRACGMALAKSCGDPATRSTEWIAKVQYAGLSEAMRGRMAGNAWAILPQWLRPVLASLIVRAEENTARGAVDAREPPVRQVDFDSPRTPNITLEQYVANLYWRYFPSERVWLRAIGCLQRLLSLGSVRVTDGCVHRLVLASVQSAAWAEQWCEAAPYGVDADELRRICRVFGGALGGDFSVSTNEIAAALAPFSGGNASSILQVELVRCGMLARGNVRSRSDVSEWAESCELPDPVQDAAPAFDSE